MFMFTIMNQCSLIRQTKSPKCNGNALDTYHGPKPKKCFSNNLWMKWNGMKQNHTFSTINGLKFDSCLIAGKSKISCRDRCLQMYVQPSICHHVNRHFGCFTSYSYFFFAATFFICFHSLSNDYIAREWNRSNLVAHQLCTDVGQNGFCSFIELKNVSNMQILTNQC